MKTANLKGIYDGTGKIIFDENKSIEWKELSPEQQPNLPLGSGVELIIYFDEDAFLTGKKGVVWATYDSRQAKIIHGALFAQHINSEVEKIDIQKENMFILKITNQNDINDAIEFIWKGKSGLRLIPDWNYSKGEINKSFEIWLSGK